MAAVLQARADQHSHLSNTMESREGDKNPSRPQSAVNNTKTTTVTTNPEPKSVKPASLPPLNPDHGPPPPPPPADETPGADYFSFNTRFAEEPNPFEHSFATGGEAMTPTKAILPPVASIASPAPLGGPGTGNSSVFNWQNSLRSGPLSPAMLQGPANTSMGPGGPMGYDQHLRTGLTPNESGIRSGLTPGGVGMYQNPTPSSQLFQQFVQPGLSTPGTMEFKKTALSAAAKKSGFANHTSPQMEKTTLPDVQSISNDNKSRRSSLIENLHDPAQNAAANGLYLLAQQTHSQPENQYGNSGTIMPSQSLAPSNLMEVAMHKSSSTPLLPTMPGGPVMSNSRGMSEMSDDLSDSGSDGGTNSSRGRNGRKGGSTAGSRRKASDDSGKARKRSRVSGDGSDDEMGDDDKSQNGSGEKSTKKMTDEEKRKNFLERNRVAALKCRQRKKQWLQSLQKKVELYSTENDALSATVTSLREELVALKTLLLSHKDCPHFPQNINLDAFAGMSNALQMPDYGQHPNYQMNPNVNVMQHGGRRYS